MKFLSTSPATALSVALATALLIVGCSQEDTTIVLENPPADLIETPKVGDTGQAVEASSEPDSETEAEADTGEDEDAEDEKDADEKPDTEGVEQKNVKLEVQSQTTVGQITVKKVATSRDGWVSIHKSKEDGSIVLPESIGEARVDSGDSEDVIVDLWEAPDVGEKLWVLLHIDGGERGKYEFPEKDVPVKKNGETMARSFTIKERKKDEEEDAE